MDNEFLKVHGQMEMDQLLERLALVSLASAELMRSHNQKMLKINLSTYDPADYKIAGKHDTEANTFELRLVQGDEPAFPEDPEAEINSTAIQLGGNNGSEEVLVNMNGGGLNQLPREIMEYHFQVIMCALGKLMDELGRVNMIIDDSDFGTGEEIAIHSDFENRSFNIVRALS